MKDLRIKRDSNIELLRVVSMLFIIAHHLVVYGVGIDIDFQLLELNRFVVPFFWAGGKLGVALFAMITGYFMVNSKISLKKIFMLELQVLFFSISIMFFLSLMGKVSLSFFGILKYILPNIFGTYGFYSCYFILYLLVPYLNRLLLSLNRREFSGLMFILVIFFFLIPTFLIYNDSIHEVVYLIIYYLIGSYIRLFLNEIKVNNGYFLGGFLVSYLFIVITVYCLRYLSGTNLFLRNYIYCFTRNGSILIFICAVCLFLFFRSLKIKSSRFINSLASVSFGVYLFHDHPLIRNFLWFDIFGMDMLINSSLFGVYGIGIVVLVYIIGALIEYIRQFLFVYLNKFFSRFYIFNKINYFID